MVSFGWPRVSLQNIISFERVFFPPRHRLQKKKAKFVMSFCKLLIVNPLKGKDFAVGQIIMSVLVSFWINCSTLLIIVSQLASSSEDAIMRCWTQLESTKMSKPKFYNAVSPLYIGRRPNLFFLKIVFPN